MHAGLTQALDPMFNFSSFIPEEPGLARAGGLLLAEVLVFVLLSFALAEMGIQAERLLFIGLFFFNLAPAYLLAMAAKSQGRNAVAFGLFSLIPAGAIFSFFVLRNDDLSG